MYAFGANTLPAYVTRAVEGSVRELEQNKEVGGPSLSHQQIPNTDMTGQKHRTS